MSESKAYRESTCEELAEVLINNYYDKHCTKDQFKRDIAEAIRQSHIAGFMECKREVSKGLLYRINSTQNSVEVLESKGQQGFALEDLKSRTNEVLTIRYWVQGMVVKKRV